MFTLSVCQMLIVLTAPSSGFSLVVSLLMSTAVRGCRLFRLLVRRSFTVPGVRVDRRRLDEGHMEDQ